MKRRFSQLATALSLLLLLATPVLWARSYIGRGGAWSILTQSRRYHFEAKMGQVNLGFRPEPAAQPNIHYWETTLAVTVIYGTMGGRLFFQILFPLWIPAILFATYPLLRAAQWYRQPAPAGLCPTCGYDLRAHREGDRCPECGTVPTTAAR